MKKYPFTFVTPGRCLSLAEHTVVPGKEIEFEKGAIDTGRPFQGQWAFGVI
jgi:hypothetical protein